MSRKIFLSRRKTYRHVAPEQHVYRSFCLNKDPRGKPRGIEATSNGFRCPDKRSKLRGIAPKENKMNMILIGNETANDVWRRLSSHLGVKVTADGLSWRTRFWRGKSLNFQLVLMHPNDETRRIVLVGGNNFSKEGFGTLNLSRDGWFKCAVWNEENGVQNLYRNSIGIGLNYIIIK
jgi:hypothetical protein